MIQLTYEQLRKEFESMARDWQSILKERDDAFQKLKDAQEKIRLLKAELSKCNGQTALMIQGHMMH